MIKKPIVIKDSLEELVFLFFKKLIDSEIFNIPSNIRIKNKSIFEKYNSRTKTNNSLIELFDPEEVYKRGILNNVVK